MAATIVIRPDSTRFDLLDDMVREVYGITDPDAHLDSISDTYKWRWAMDEMIQQMSEEEFRSALDYIARAHDVDVMELDSVACAIMDTLDCTAEAAQGMREWVFDAVSDSVASLAQLRADLGQFGAWYPDDEALKDDYFTYSDGELFERLDPDEAPAKCEADVWYDASFGYLVLFR